MVKFTPNNMFAFFITHISFKRKKPLQQYKNYALAFINTIIFFMNCGRYVAHEHEILTFKNIQMTSYARQS